MTRRRTRQQLSAKQSTALSLAVQRFAHRMARMVLAGRSFPFATSANLRG